MHRNKPNITYLPQNRYFQKLCAIQEVAVRPNMMADLPILHFRNP